MIELIGHGVLGALRWLWDVARTAREVPPVPLWLVVLLGLAYLVAYRVGRRRGRQLIGRLLDPQPWKARRAVLDDQFLLDGEHQRMLEALGGQAAGLATSSVAALTNLAWGSVKEVAAELEDGGYVAVNRYHRSGDWLIQLTPEGRRALRAVAGTGRRSLPLPRTGSAVPSGPAPSAAPALRVPVPGLPPRAGGPMTR